MSRFRTQVLVQLFTYINFIINVLIFIPYGSIMDPLHTQEKNSFFEVCLTKRIYIQQNLKKPKNLVIRY